MYFLQNYHTMNRRNATDFKQECMAFFGWHWTTFYKKLDGRIPLRPNEYKDLARIINKYLTKGN